MCIGDWRLGAVIRSVVSEKLTLATTSTIILANNTRVGITIGLAIPGATTASYGTVKPEGLQLVLLNSSHPFVHFTLATHGDLSFRSFTLTAANINCQFGIVEYFMPEEYLRVGIEEFKRGLMR